jgi:nucleotide-binding universal stress UspA family protein
VVVGVDRLGESRAAVIWAAAEAERRGVALRIVHAEFHPVTVDVVSAGYSVQVVEQLDESARRGLEAAAATARNSVPGFLDVTTRLVHAHPRDALAEAARDASLLVTGARRRSRLRAAAFGGFQLGSTSLYVVSHVPCPTAVVRALPPRGPRDRRADVVVGYDGSTESEAALGWAVRHARSLGSTLRVLTVWQAPLGSNLSPFGYDPQNVEDLRRIAREAARTRLDAAVARLRREFPGVVVRAELVEDEHPSDVLLAAGAVASVVVTGARGRGPFASALLGSTGHAVLHRAHGPVVVVPAVPSVTEPVRPEVRDRAVPAAVVS